MRPLNSKIRPRSILPKSLLLAAAAAVVAIATFAQAPGDSKAVSPSKVERKNRAPVSKEILRVKLPRPVEAKLPNGLTVLILEDHRFPIVTVDFTIDGAGALWEPEDQHGLAGVTAQMLREGTATHNSKQINEAIDQLGASFFANAPFGDGAASIGATGLSDNFDQWFPMATDLLLNANFPDSELAKLKQRLKIQLVQQRQQPNFLATERFNEAVYGHHPAATVAGTPESIDALTSEKLVAVAQNSLCAAEHAAGNCRRCKSQGNDCEVDGVVCKVAQERFQSGCRLHPLAKLNRHTCMSSIGPDPCRPRWPWEISQLTAPARTIPPW